MQKLLLAAAVAAGLGFGMDGAFAQTLAPSQPGPAVSVGTYAAAPIVQAQNSPATRQTAPQSATTSAADTSGLWRNGQPWSPANPDMYNVPGG